MTKGIKSTHEQMHVVNQESRLLYQFLEKVEPTISTKQKESNWSISYTV